MGSQDPRVDSGFPIRGIISPPHVEFDFLWDFLYSGSDRFGLSEGNSNEGFY